jgi:hypothetical protein
MLNPLGTSLPQPRRDVYVNAYYKRKLTFQVTSTFSDGTSTFLSPKINIWVGYAQCGAGTIAYTWSQTLFLAYMP